jgi:sulfur carrier protein ThiS
MTVAELIRELKFFDKDAVVMVEDTRPLKREVDVKDLVELDNLHTVETPRGIIIVLMNTEEMPRYFMN